MNVALMLLMCLGAVKNEKYYETLINKTLQGKTSQVTPAGTFVDILTEDLAIEVDFAKKWYQAIGQACHYSVEMKRRPAIYLIVREESDEKYVKRALKVCKRIKVLIPYKDGPIAQSIVVFVIRDIE